MPARLAAQLLAEGGEPTALARELYTEGDCWILAFELGLKLNSPLLAVVDPEDPHMWDHVVVDLGRETVLDVDGRATRDEITSRWSRPSYPMTLRELGRHYDFTSYLRDLDGDGVACTTIVTEEEREHAKIVADGLISLHLTPEKVA